MSDPSPKESNWYCVCGEPVSLVVYLAKARDHIGREQSTSLGFNKEVI